MKVVVVVLTLARHSGGVWVTRLKEELESLKQVVQIVTLESILEGQIDIETTRVRVIVNRVSDAAEPHFVKACCGFLACCGVPVWNGPEAYAICSNKWCQHNLLKRAGLEAPRTLWFFKGNIPDEMDLCFPLLFKPNSGGFGTGIIKVSNNEDLSTALAEARLLDHVGLLQEFLRVECIFRVWWLNLRVQCGVIRELDMSDQFTHGCAGGAACSVSHTPPTFRAYAIPDDVREEIEDKLLPLLPAAHSGSVEFLINDQGERLYFDINLLSTLPLVEKVEQNDQVWGRDYNPWKQLAASIAEYGCP